MDAQFTTVMSTVNAPYSHKLDAEMLAQCLKSLDLAKMYPGHVSSFFGDVKANSQLSFAKAYGISQSDLSGLAKEFSTYSGETYPIAL